MRRGVRGERAQCVGDKAIIHCENMVTCGDGGGCRELTKI